MKYFATKRIPVLSLRKLITIVCLSISCIAAAQPSGYYNNAGGLTCAALKTALKTIITNGNSPQSYSALWTQYILTDVKPRTVGTGSANVIFDNYSANLGGVDPYQFTPGPVASGGQQDNGTLGTAEGQLYNREHTVPQSWFGGNTGVSGVATDYLFVFPCDKYVNGKRGDMPYCEVATASQTFKNGSKIGTSAIAGITGDGANKVFEPIDSIKGDVARSFFYFITRYEDNMSSWPASTIAAEAFGYNTYPSITIPYLQMMLRWHHLDPVSAREKTRNDGAYSLQGNRNPFVDHPEYVDSVWNSRCSGLGILPVDIIYFTGKVNGNNLNLNWGVAAEINLSYYEIERSLNGTTYTSIGTQNAAGVISYSFNDPIENIAGKRVYYRIKKVDKDGSFTYSNVFTIHLPLNAVFTIYPNPAKDFITVNCNDAKELMITDYTGRIVYKSTVNSSSTIVNLKDFANGIYFVRLNVNDNTVVGKFAVEK